MISKELLSEVLGEDFDKVAKINNAEFFIHLRGTELVGFVDQSRLQVACPRREDYMSINIYELAHKCKEWAFNKKNCNLNSGKHEVGEGLRIGYECEVTERYTQHYITSSICETEPEAIFKACEWILNEI